MTNQHILFSKLKNPIHFFALGFGSGCIPKIPGTAGTLVGIIFYIPLQYLSLSLYVGIVIGFFILGIWLCEKSAKDLGVHDHPAIVWDEIVGYLTTMIAAPTGWYWILFGFIAFRLFDIWKPWPVRWADNKVTGGLGIMLDDLVAAMFAFLSLQIIVYISYSY